MIICCYAQIDRQWSEQELADKLLLLPENLHAEALRKRIWIDRQLNIAGKLLLVEVLKQFRQSLSLHDLQYNTHHRPYFNNSIDFNIAHSGNLVICCGTNVGKIGADIEQVKEIDLAEYHDHFTANEWNIIRNYPDILNGFFNFWTRKESILKAIGTGLHTPLSSVDVANDDVNYDDVAYYIQKLNIDAGYPCHIATTGESGNVKLLSVNI
ncbi:MAG TPA: 4'-phosphopantetheinyl transferase superfamily protein [Mucilaginibacter sp.]|nr:4'-phosphopantetheinyl transferase superfamily protein [Mucilaginibacter sp.]